MNTKRSNIKEYKSNVFIIQKQHQRTGQTTKGIVKEILTNASYHPRGIKVRLVEGEVGRIHSFVTDSEESLASQNPVSVTTNNRQQNSVSVTTNNRQRWVLNDFITKQNDIPNDSIHEQISCKQCTFLNSNLLQNCEICNSQL